MLVTRIYPTDKPFEPSSFAVYRTPRGEYNFAEIIHDYINPEGIAFTPLILNSMDDTFGQVFLPTHEMINKPYRLLMSNLRNQVHNSYLRAVKQVPTADESDIYGTLWYLRKKLKKEGTVDTQIKLPQRTLKVSSLTYDDMISSGLMCVFIVGRVLVSPMRYERVLDKTGYMYKTIMHTFQALKYMGLVSAHRGSNGVRYELKQEPDRVFKFFEAGNKAIERKLDRMRRFIKALQFKKDGKTLKEIEDMTGFPQPTLTDYFHLNVKPHLPKQVMKLIIEYGLSSQEEAKLFEQYELLA